MESTSTLLPSGPMNNVKIPHYQEGEDPAGWIEIYEDGADVYKWDDQTKLKASRHT